MKFVYSVLLFVLGIQFQIQAQEIFEFVEQMPLFPGCEEIVDSRERKQCSDQKMLTYIYKNIKYPILAREAGVEGMAIVSFIVGVDGKLSGLEILRDPGAGLGQEALCIIDKMNEEGVIWSPGKMRGKNVAVRYKIPVRFTLGTRGGDAMDCSFPLFSKECLVEGDLVDQRTHSDRLFNEFIQENKRTIAVEKGYPRVWIKCSFDKTGKMINYSSEAPEGPFRNEAFRLIELLNKKHINWVPATVNGRDTETSVQLLIDLY